MSRFTFCNCPAGFAASPERHAPDCPGRSLAAIRPTPVTMPLRPSLAEKWDCPKLPAEFQPEIDTSYSAQRAAFLELLQKTRQEHDEMRETILLRALGMTAEEAVANRHRISRHCHPDQDVFLVDGEPVVAIHKPVIRGDELVTSYQILRKPT